MPPCGAPTSPPTDKAVSPQLEQCEMQVPGLGTKSHDVSVKMKYSSILSNYERCM